MLGVAVRMVGLRQAESASRHGRLHREQGIAVSDAVRGDRGRDRARARRWQLLVGWRTRWAAALLAVFLIVITPIFHDFWSVPAEQVMMQQINFFKNAAILAACCSYTPWARAATASTRLEVRALLTEAAALAAWQRFFVVRASVREAQRGVLGSLRLPKERGNRANPAVSRFQCERTNEPRAVGRRHDALHRAPHAAPSKRLRRARTMWSLSSRIRWQ
jgi:hypothetical protein